MDYCEIMLKFFCPSTLFRRKIAHFELICAKDACGLRKITYFRKVLFADR